MYQMAQMMDNLIIRLEYPFHHLVKSLLVKLEGIAKGIEFKFLIKLSQLYLLTCCLSHLGSLMFVLHSFSCI
jgi:hypothetical protein